jgi:hypothetical protein
MKDLFNKISNYAEKTFDAQVNVVYTDEFVGTFLELDGLVFPEYPPLIDIYVPFVGKEVVDKYPWNVAICVLLHEIGHIICERTIGIDHTESQAWEAAEGLHSFIPDKDQFLKIKHQALKSYWIEQNA